MVREVPLESRSRRLPAAALAGLAVGGVAAELVRGSGGVSGGCSSKSVWRDVPARDRRGRPIPWIGITSDVSHHFAGCSVSARGQGRSSEVSSG